MPSLCFLVTIVAIFSISPCEGVITAPRDMTEYTSLSGRTVNITWVFNDVISTVVTRAWSLANTTGPGGDLAEIYRENKPSIRTKLYDVDVIEPATLVLKNVNQSYNGIYTFSLTVSASPGFVTRSRSVRVFIAKKPTVILNCPSLVTLKEGDNFVCLCRGEGGNPPANVTWFKNGVKFTDVGTERQTLNLSNVAEAYSGTYKCEATSYPHENYTDEKSIQVTVYFAPTKTAIHYSPKKAVINGSVSITCISHGLPEPRYAMYHNDTKLNITDNFYFIPVVMRKHAGTYKCIANNSIGTDSASKHLNVTERPSPTEMTSSTIRSEITSSRTILSSTTPSVPGGGKDTQGGVNHGLIWGLVAAAIVLVAIALVCCFYKFCKKPKENPFLGPNERRHADVNPNGSRVTTNQYELEEDHGEDAGAYDTVKQSDDGEGSQDKKKPAGDSLPPVYASVNKDNRQGNTLYASLDSEALRKPGSKKKQPETKNAPTEYASIDFMQTGKTPNADNA